MTWTRTILPSCLPSVKDQSGAEVKTLCSRTLVQHYVIISVVVVVVVVVVLRSRITRYVNTDSVHTLNSADINLKFKIAALETVLRTQNLSR